MYKGCVIIKIMIDNNHYDNKERELYCILGMFHVKHTNAGIINLHL